MSGSMLRLEASLSRGISKELRQTEIWPWLSQFPGLGGVHTARLISIIRDPRRFPGQPCSLGHISPAIHEIGTPCPIVTLDGPCHGAMVEQRPHTGVASLWHYCGLHAIDGHSPRKRKGVKVDWNTRAKTCILMPGGIAEQIVKQRVPVYRNIYDQTKERLSCERGIEGPSETDECADAALTEGTEADSCERVIEGLSETEERADAALTEGTEADSCERGIERPSETEERLDAALTEGTEAANASETDKQTGLRPFQIDAIARKVAAKAFVGDLLTEWKRILA